MKQLHSLFAITALSGLMWTSSAGGPTPSPAPSPATVPMGWTSGSTGADGNLDFGDPGSLPPGITETSANNFLVDLAQFPSNYDPVRWAMIFNYQNITVPAGISVTFANHPSRAPVAWLATGNVSIDGVVQLAGLTGMPADEDHRSWAEPGPGGFRGGRGGYFSNGDNSAGFGPGGGIQDSAGCNYGGPAAHATSGGDGVPTYGSAAVVPLIGGSRGGAGSGGSSGGGGAGGGAILIAADGDVVVSGLILADGGGGGFAPNNSSTNCTRYFGSRGSGGAIRLVANRVELNGALLRAKGDVYGWGYDGGDGRIRIETNGAQNYTVTGAAIAPTEDYQDSRSEVFPTQQPSLKVASIDDGMTLTQIDVTDPAATFQPAQLADVQFEAPSVVTLNVEASNIAPGWLVQARVAHTRGEAAWYPATDMGVPLVGDMMLSTCSIPNVDLAGGVSAVQLRAWNPNP